MNYRYKHKVLTDGRQFFTWILGDGSFAIEILHPRNYYEDGIIYKRYHNSEQISASKLEKLINGE